MTLIVAFLVSHLGLIIGAVVGGAGVVFGAFRHQQAKAATATAAATVATSAAQVAQGNAAVAEATTDAVANQASAATAAAAIPDAQLDAAGEALGILRKD